MPRKTDRQMVWIRRSCSVLCYITTLIGIAILHTGLIEPKNTYVHCNDTSLYHPFKADTISASVLVVTTFGIPLFVMTLFEWWNFRQNSSRSPLHNGVKKATYHFLSLFAGGSFAFFVVEVLKTTVCHPRPNFMSTCKPNFTKEQCEDTLILVTRENCTNPLELSKMQLIDSMKSFPSGHACLALFGATFMTMYIQRRVHLPYCSSMFKVWFQFLWCVWALFCCASRILDSKHHGWDVIFGGIIGIVAGYVTGAYLCNWFEKDSTQYLDEHLPIDKRNESPPQTLLNNTENRGDS